ncbi:MAG: sensor histidine kinase, partial [Desulfobulbaceae bacterium]|nr:sensor histidine kinase [Desulfobulbaceae bacterium]
MTRSKWFFHPILIFIFSIFALGLSLFLYIYWYIEVSAGLNDLIARFSLDPDEVLESHTWVVILVLSILVGIILVGIFIAFIYYYKLLQLYRLQHNFISNFTHELKTPVTSLKLYLETFLKHDLSQEDRKKYVRYMIQDVGRLSDNINSILNLARIESKNYVGEFVETDVVSVVKQFYLDNEYLFQECEIVVH